MALELQHPMLLPRARVAPVVAVDAGATQDSHALSWLLHCLSFGLSQQVALVEQQVQELATLLAT